MSTGYRLGEAAYATAPIRTLAVLTDNVDSHIRRAVIFGADRLTDNIDSHIRRAEADAGGGELALDPFRPRLVCCALQADGLFGTISMLRSAIEEHEVTKQVDIPEWPDPVINFAGGMVDGAIENLDAARTLLYRAAELTEERLVHLWAERMLGTKHADRESNP